MSIKKPLGGKDVLATRAPHSTIYDNRVDAKVDSGPNMVKVHKLWSECRLNVRAGKSERFRRIKASTLAALLEAHEVVDFLLLDLREEDEFDACHIEGARPYPARLFRHATQPFSAEVLQYKNREPARVIIVYDEADTGMAADVGNLLYEKGVDNVFVVSGGLRRLHEVEPGHVSGFLPPLPTTSGPHKTSKKGPELSSRALGGSSGRPGTAQTEHTQQSVSTVAELFSRLDATRSASKAGSIATHSVASRRPGPGGGGGNVSVRAQGSVAGFGPQSPGSPARSAVWRPSGNA